jgi:hypothetical protein
MISGSRIEVLHMANFENGNASYHARNNKEITDVLSVWHRKQ